MSKEINCPSDGYADNGTNEQIAGIMNTKIQSGVGVDKCPNEDENCVFSGMEYKRCYHG